jgi:hypothetical protein
MIWRTDACVVNLYLGRVDAREDSPAWVDPSSVGPYTLASGAPEMLQPESTDRGLLRWRRWAIRERI